MENRDGEVYVGARVERQLADDLKALAAHSDRSVAQEIRRALRMWVMSQLDKVEEPAA